MKRKKNNNSLRTTSPVGPATDPEGPEESLSPAERLRRLNALVRLSDDVFRIPGTKWRVGLDGLLGLVPGLGDVAGVLISAYLMKEAARLGANRATLARMTGNVLMDFAVGAVPLLGDVFDLAFKANRRNYRLLEKHLARLEKQKSTGLK